MNWNTSHKKPNLDPRLVVNYQPVVNLPYLGKVLARVVAGQLQVLLDETDFLDPFKSGFRLGFGTETALVTLYDDLCRERDRGSVTLFIDTPGPLSGFQHHRPWCPSG